MIATIILPDIQAYTKRVMADFKIDKEHYEEDTFDEEGFLINQYKGCRLYLLPTDILHELPVAKCWEDVETAASKNNAIRQELNTEVGMTWHQWASKERKAYIRDYILKDPDAFERVMSAYREEEVGEYNLYNDIDYFLGKLLQKIKKAVDFETIEEGEIDSLTGALEVADIFKDWVEKIVVGQKSSRPQMEKRAFKDLSMPVLNITLKLIILTSLVRQTKVRDQ